MAPTNPALRRYDDAYSVASALVRQGKRYKAIGSVLVFISILLGAFSLLALLAGLAPGSGQQNPFGTGFRGPSSGVLGIGGLFISLGIGSIGSWLIRSGTLLSAQGQLLFAQLDIAVHTSPFLDTEEKRSVLDLDLDLPAQGVAEHQEDTVTCRQCAAVNPVANQYCESCGRRLESVLA